MKILHYDAQADLIGVLEEQDAAAQVIYTTHSPASLPNDLGAGVRVVWILDGDAGGRSRRKFLVKNKGPAEQIHLLEAGGKGIDLEDLIHAKAYKAVNSYVEDVGGTGEFDDSDLPKRKLPTT